MRNVFTIITTLTLLLITISTSVQADSCREWHQNELVDLIPLHITKSSDPGNSNYPAYDTYAGTLSVGTVGGRSGNVALTVTVGNGNFEIKTEMPTGFNPLFPRWIMVSPIYRRGVVNRPNIGFWLDMAADPSRNFQYCYHDDPARIVDIVGIIVHKAHNG